MKKYECVCGYVYDPAIGDQNGGIAPGVDRMVMLLAGEDNIREVIAFPMNQKAQDLMMNAPSDVTEKQLRELHIKIRGREGQPVES